MLVQISGGDAQGEWCLLEFQGEILGDLQGELGTLIVKGKTAEMEIGQHVLEGEVVVLKTPFLVVEKSAAEAAATGEEGGKGSGGAEGAGSGSSNMSVSGVATRKILFSARPKNKRIA